ncbi:MAG: phosphatase PAP2 family protein [Candidatus Sulfotelmatobacter sp.]
MNQTLSILRQSISVGFGVTVLSLSACSQDTPFNPELLQPAPTQETVLAPNFRVAAFRLQPLDTNTAGTDAAPDTSAATEPQQGLVKRSVTRIGQDQKRLYLAPFKPHNFKWDAIVLIGTGAFLAADRHIENNVPNSHFQLYQDTSDIAIAGLAASLGGIYLYGIKTEHQHARETGELELETLVNTFLIYTPMQLILGRQRPGEGNGQGDFFKHHALNTSFPSGHAMFTWAMASVLADEYPKPWARVLSYGAAFTVTFTRFMARDHWSSDIYLGTGLGLAIAENTFHARCDPQYPSQCKHHQRWWKAVKVGVQ